MQSIIGPSNTTIGLEIEALECALHRSNGHIEITVGLELDRLNVPCIVERHNYTLPYGLHG